MSKETYDNRSNPFDKVDADDEINYWTNSSKEKPISPKMQKMKQEIDESEQRQLDSTQRALASIAESEQIGKVTAEELARQGEQLNNIEQNTTKINQDLKVTQQHIRKIRSPFARFKDWWNGDNAKDTPEPKSKGSPAKTTDNYKASSGINDARGFLDDDDDDNANGGPDGQTQYFKPITKSDQEQKVNENLNKMSDGMSRLKGLAADMGGELEKQNEQLDRINDATSDVQGTIEDQNKQIRKLLN